NSDGEITIQDATAIQSYLAGLTNLTDFEKTAADIDGIGEIDIIDVTTLQKKLANII
ncbi:MAG: dockerin type I domain-containing protein, partial [Acutalibacteraceae bacterium]